MWSALLLGAIEIVASIFLAQVLRQYLEDPSLDKDLRLDVLWRFFGTSGRTCYTMFEVTFGGWHRVARPLVEKVNPYLLLFWVPYQVVVSFTIMRIVGALFIKETIAVANKEHAREIEERLNGSGNDVETIRALLHKYDNSSDGELNENEFYAALRDPGVRMWLADFEVDPSRVIALYELLDNGDGQMSLEEFIAGVFSLKEEKGVDTVTLMYATERVINFTRAIQDKLYDVAHTQAELLRVIQESSNPKVG